MNRWLAAALALVALAAAGCGGSGDGAAEPVTIEGGEYAFVMPDEVDGGVASMRFRNTGKEPHEFALSRIDEGHSIDEMIRDLLANEDVPYATDIGGVPLLSPGDEITITRPLEPGTYALLCFFPSPNGTPHVDLGMKREFRAVGESSTTLPTPDTVITATANGYSVPGDRRGDPNDRTAKRVRQRAELVSVRPAARSNGRGLRGVDRGWPEGRVPGEIRRRNAVVPVRRVDLRDP